VWHAEICPDKKLIRTRKKQPLAGVKKETALPREYICAREAIARGLIMHNPQADRDRADLERLENIVKRRKTIGTAALSTESGISPERVRELLTDYFSSVRQSSSPLSFGEGWAYTPTMADKAAEHECKEQENQLEHQRRQSGGL
jgi:hypothetical protein